MKILCELIAGSRLYGIDTPESDFDIRGVFLNTEPSKILGLEKSEILKEENEDSLLFEFNHYLKSLRKTNTQAIEILFAKSFLKYSEEFGFLQNNKYKLIDSEKLFCSLMGYIENEKRLAIGERKGDIGSKRRNQLEKYGFSPKNFSHMIRLAFCGSMFFKIAHYPVSLKGYEIRDLIFSIKTEPEKYTIDQLNDIADQNIEELKKSFEKRNKNYKFDLDFANEVCLKCYKPYL
jgi:predicted nucleotidyltransferase